MRSPFSSRGFPQNRAPEYRAGLKVPVVCLADPVDGWGGTPWVLGPSRLQDKVRLITILSLFLDLPTQGLASCGQSVQSVPVRCQSFSVTRGVWGTINEPWGQRTR